MCYFYIYFFALLNPLNAKDMFLFSGAMTREIIEYVVIVF